MTDMGVGKTVYHLRKKIDEIGQAQLKTIEEELEYKSNEVRKLQENLERYKNQSITWGEFFKDELGDTVKIVSSPIDRIRDKLKETKGKNLKKRESEIISDIDDKRNRCRY